VNQYKAIVLICLIVRQFMIWKRKIRSLFNPPFKARCSYTI